MTPREKSKPKCAICSNGEDCPIGWIMCNNCKQWSHGECLKASKEEFKLLGSTRFWFCASCCADSNIKYDLKKATIMAVKELNGKVLDVNTPDATDKLDDVNLDKVVDLVIEKLWPKCVELIEVKFSQVETNFKDLHNRISDLEHDNFRLDRDRKRKNLIIQGIPNDLEVNDATFMSKIAEFLELEKFYIDDVEDCFRVGTSRIKPIIVRFHKLIHKRVFFAKYINQLKNKKLTNKIFDDNYPDSPVYINEHLDNFTSKLFAEARKLKSSPKVTKVIVKNGWVTVWHLDVDSQTKRCAIRSFDDIVCIKQIL